jgi:Transposase DDE domain
MTAKLSSEDGKACYAKRKQTIEPVFRQLKEQQGARRFLRRGMAACQAEWKLLCGTLWVPEISSLTLTCCFVVSRRCWRPAR